MNYSDFYNRFSKKLYSVKKFTNKHKERFYIIRTKTAPPTYLITGDEYDWELIPLFNTKFDIYTDLEIKNIAKCLQDLVK